MRRCSVVNFAIYVVPFRKLCFIRRCAHRFKTTVITCLPPESEATTAVAWRRRWHVDSTRIDWRKISPLMLCCYFCLLKRSSDEFASEKSGWGMEDGKVNITANLSFKYFKRKIWYFQSFWQMIYALQLSYISNNMYLHINYKYRFTW